METTDTAGYDTQEPAGADEQDRAVEEAKRKQAELFEVMPIPRAVMKLVLPTIAASLVTVLYSLADTYFVGLLNQPVQTAAVTLAAPVLLAFYAVNNLFGVGSASMMGRALGRRDYDAVRASAAFGFYGALACSLLFSLLCAVFQRPLLLLLGADATTLPVTARYLNWTVTAGAAPAILNVVLAYMIRSEGASLHASIGTMSGALLNIVLDPIFVLPWGLDLGAEGAALATFLSNCVALLYFLIYLRVRRSATNIRLSPRWLRLRRDIVLGVCGVGVPAAVQNLLNVVASSAINALAAPFGAEALAAMGICTRVSMVPMYVALGLSQGLMPLVSYNYASGNASRLKGGLWFAARIDLAILLGLGAVLFAAPDVVVRAFLNDSATVAYGAVFLRGLTLSLPAMGLDFLAVAVFQATGMGRESLLFAILRKLVFEIPALYLLNAVWPLYGLSYAQFVSETLTAVLAMIVLLRFLRRFTRGGDAPQDGAIAT